MDSAVELLSLGDEEPVFMVDDHEVLGAIKAQALVFRICRLSPGSMEEDELGEEDETGASVLEVVVFDVLVRLLSLLCRS
jgi:hypothetical protein